MKTVTNKYLEMNHNFIELRDSIVQKIKDEKEFKDAINFAIETYRKMSKFNKEWEEES